MHERTIIVLHIKILAMNYVKVNFVFDYENLKILGNYAFIKEMPPPPPKKCNDGIDAFVCIATVYI